MKPGNSPLILIILICCLKVNLQTTPIINVYKESILSETDCMSIELNGAEIENQLRKIVSSGARMDGLLNISFDEYTSVSVLLPSTEEQDCIADFFRQLDNLITLHQRKWKRINFAVHTD